MLDSGIIFFKSSDMILKTDKKKDSLCVYIFGLFFFLWWSQISPFIISFILLAIFKGSYADDKFPWFSFVWVCLHFPLRFWRIVSPDIEFIDSSFHSALENVLLLPSGLYNLEEKYTVI